MSIIDEILKKYNTPGLIANIAEDSNSIPTGIYSLDDAIGVGGFPTGRLTEIFGPPYSGKSSLALALISSLHRLDQKAKAIYIDAESCLDLNYTRKCGVDLERVVILHPEYAEQAFDIAEQTIRSGEFHVVVVDSVPALSPRVEIEGEVGDAHIGLLPRLIAQFLRRTAFAIRESGVALVFINQIRDKIARMPISMIETPGGHALKHYASVRLFLRNDGEIKQDSNVIGSKIVFNIKKNKVGPPSAVGTFEIWGDRGVNLQAALLDKCVECDIIKMRGSWFILDDKPIAQGRIACINQLTENKDLFERLKERLDGAKF